MKFNLDALMRGRVKDMGGIFVDEGREIPADEAKSLVCKWYAAGLEVGPPCCNQDEKGRCLGHPNPQAIAEGGI